MIYVGADWDSEKCVVAYEQDGKKHGGSVMRRPKEVRAFMEQLGDEGVLVAIESGDRLWARLWANAGAKVAVFDAKKVNRFGASLCSSGASDDKRSAEALRLMAMSQPHQAHTNAEVVAPIASLSRLLALVHVASSAVGNTTNRLAAHLRQLHPAVAEVVGRSITAAWFLGALKEAPTPEAWNELDDARRAQLLKGSSRAKREEYMRAFGEDWGAFEPIEEQPVRVVVSAHALALINALQAQRSSKQALEEACAAAAAERQDTVGEMAGIGPFLLSAVTVGLDGADGRDDLAIALGAAPVTKRSGVTGDRRQHASMRRAAPPVMKKASHLLGFQLVGHYCTAKAQYAHYRSRGISANGAYRRVTRSFSRVFTAMQRDNIPFDEERYILALKANGVAWARDL
jgi:hypothetical protein